MKYHIHIPKLLELALNVVCDDVTLHGEQCLITPIPYPLYLRCIMTYADKCDRFGYSLFRFYRDIRQKNIVSVLIGRLYPNVLDHVVLDDDVDAELITQVTHSPLFYDAAASIQRFASRCLAADKSEWLKSAMSQVLMKYHTLPKPILDVFLFYGAKLDRNSREFFIMACLRGVNDVIKQYIENGHIAHMGDMIYAIRSGNCETIKLVFSAYRGRLPPKNSSSVLLDDATVQLMELILSLNIIQRKTYYSFSNIPSFSVLQWILDHDVMEHDVMLIDIASNASSYSGHYFDMLKYVIEQRNFTVPRDMFVQIFVSQATDLDVFNYLMLHGADVNAVDIEGRNVLEHSPLVIRYWIDKGLVVQSNDAHTMIHSVQYGMTVAVLEMMIDKYELNVNAARTGYTALDEACRNNNYEVAEMLLQRGVVLSTARHPSIGNVPYNTRDNRMRQLLIEHGYDIR